MKRLGLLLSVVSLAAHAAPSGKRWGLQACTTTCTVNGAATAAGNLACTAGRCLPEVRFADSIANTGGATINGTAAVSYTTALASMRSGFERWTTPNVTSCSTSMMFAFQPNFTSPSGTAAINGNDGNNNVIWLGGTSWRYGSGTLGLTGTYFFPGRLLDADMELNNNIRWAVTGATGATDIESVVTHEAGHFIGFDHTTTGSAVMNPSIGAGVVKRNLLSADLSDVCTVYPGTAGGQGSACNTGADCTGGRVCEGPTGSTTLLCTQDCTGAGQTCPTGYSCQASTSGFACLPQVGVTDQCRFCTAGADCSTGICLTNGDGVNWCSQACTPNTPGQCAAGSSCQASGNGGYCVPDTACTNQCTPSTAAADCAPGYACTGGTCIPTGATGDRCEASDFCQPCNACAVDENDSNIAFCRACCNNAASLCTGCTATTCAAIGGATHACFSITGRSERICFPDSGAGLCQACSASSPCATGSTCVAGLCRSSCNPTNPGTCAACLAQGTSGICACTPSEIADENQPCSSTSPLAICRTGLRCLGGTCRAPCTLSDPNSCNAGFTCQAVAGQTVCIPSGPTGGGAGGGPAGGGTGTGGSGGGAAAGGGNGGGGGGIATSDGGNATGGGTGVTQPPTCGPATCSGCCSNNQCVQTSDQTCGTFGSVCVACTDTQTCNLGTCIAAPKKGCGCTQFEGTIALIALTAFLPRRRRGRGQGSR